MSKPPAWRQALVNLTGALRAPFVHWRLALPLYLVAVMAVMGVYALLPLLLWLLQDRNASAVFFDPDAASDPLLLQHIMWYAGHPETLAAVTVTLGLFVWVWALGIWGGTRDGTIRWRIGWGPYARLLVLSVAAGLLWYLAPVISVLVAPRSNTVFNLVAVIGNLTFLFIVLRLSGAIQVIADGGRLKPLVAWRRAVPDHWMCMWLAMGLYLASLTLELVLIFLALLPIRIVLVFGSDFPVWGLPLASLPLFQVFALLGHVFMGLVTIAAVWNLAHNK